MKWIFSRIKHARLWQIENKQHNHQAKWKCFWTEFGGSFFVIALRLSEKLCFFYYVKWVRPLFSIHKNFDFQMAVDSRWKCDNSFKWTEKDTMTKFTRKGFALRTCFIFSVDLFAYFVEKWKKNAAKGLICPCNDQYLSCSLFPMDFYIILGTFLSLRYFPNHPRTFLSFRWMDCHFGWINRIHLWNAFSGFYVGAS